MSTEVIGFTCKSCGKKYKVKASMAGKQVKCPGCSTPLTIPSPSAQKAAASGGQQTKAQAAKAKSRTLARSGGEELGLAGPLTNEADVFSNVEAMPDNPQYNPLANHVVTDPGFALGGPDLDELDLGDADEQFAKNPIVAERERAEEEALRQYRALESTAPATAESSKSGVSPGIVFIVLSVMAAIIGSILGLTMSAQIGVMVPLIGLFALNFAMIGVQIWALFLVARNEQENATLQVVLFLFVPFYNLIYSFMNFQAMKSYLLTLLLAFISSMLLVGTLILIPFFGKDGVFG